MRFTYKHGQLISILEFTLLVTVPLLTPARLAGRAPVCTGREERGGTAGDEVRAFMGTWCGQQHGRPTVILTLKNVGTEITGSIIFYSYQDGKLVNQDEVQLLTPKLQADTLNFSLPQAPICATCHAARTLKGLVRGPRHGELLQFEMRLTSEDQAQLKTLGVVRTEFPLVRLTQRK